MRYRVTQAQMKTSTGFFNVQDEAIQIAEIILLTPRSQADDT
jgi:hypothetical protein